MKDFFTTLSIWTGAIVALLTIVDWLLTESQKKSVKGWAEYAWLWLDYQKAGRFVIYLKSYKIQLILSVVTYISLELLATQYLFRLANQSQSSRLLFALALAAIVVLVSWIIHSRIVFWVVKPDLLHDFFRRCLYMWLISLALTYSFLIVEVIFEPLESESLYVRIPFVVPFLVSSVEAGLITMMFFLSVFWYCLVLLIMALFKAVQFILLRIIENPKGPVLGISGLLVGIGALVKAFL
jgi:hypothetical protein